MQKRRGGRPRKDNLQEGEDGVENVLRDLRRSVSGVGLVGTMAVPGEGGQGSLTPLQALYDVENGSDKMAQ